MQPTNNTMDTQAFYSDPKPSKLKIILLSLAVLAGIAILATGVVLTRAEAVNQQSEASAATAEVTLSRSTFEPATVYIKKGQAVTWTNQDTQSHTITISGSDNQPIDGNNAIQINEGETYSFVFDEAGTFNYYDATSPLRFKGVVIVE